MQGIKRCIRNDLSTVYVGLQGIKKLPSQFQIQIHKHTQIDNCCWFKVIFAQLILKNGLSLYLALCYVPFDTPSDLNYINEYILSQTYKHIQKHYYTHKHIQTHKMSLGSENPPHLNASHLSPTLFVCLFDFQLCHYEHVL